MSQKHHKILIIGAGTAGITVAAQLLRKDHQMDVALIDPSDKHYYQPAWTLVGAGTFNYGKTVRPMSSVIPKGATWIKDYVEEIHPERNVVVTREGGEIGYDYLVACPGIQIDLDGIEGLKETFGQNGVSSVYVDPKYTYKTLKEFTGGNAIFTQPATPIKCGGAPQKIMYLADDFFRRQGVRENANVIFATPGSVIFGVDPFKQTLMKVVDRKDIELRFFHKLSRIDGPNKTAYYTITANADEPDKLYHNRKELGEKQISPTEVAIPFEILHLAPPQSAPDFIKRSKLAYQDGPDKGWINVDHYSLQHKEFPNVFALGDSAALPTAKTGAAVRKQAPVVVENIFHLLQHDDKLSKGYEGYSSCPLVTGYGKMLLAEFKYDNVRDSDPLISKFVDTSKEQYSMWLLKKYGLPFMYWNLMLKGRA
ncbi:MAG: NAD(P)/FAD-dependent oxidoreductase [Saprospiraceae bacterium]|nr:NAD(P)/FAD-dependent oxidoreductase [Saprospiraceae bacterium]MCB0622461.1 NAD(P)/FAD-dependent oxidoreductase [Saprospiraceae bacterium]MCB0675801.1 NAD(P)/FAD-dependent oxidoreductase [Saprospiraceae bacterium]